MLHHKCLIYFFSIFFLLAISQPLKAQDENEFKTAHQLLKNTDDSIAVSGYNKVIAYYNRLENDSAVFYARQGLQLFKERKYIRGQAWMVFALGDYDDTHGNRVAASEKMIYALSLFVARKDTAGIAKTNNVLGVIEAKKGNYDRAFKYFIEGEKLFDAIKDKEGLMATWLDLGLLYDISNDSLKTFEYYNKVDSISHFLPLSDKLIKLYNNIGAYYLGKQDSVKAFSYMRKAMALSDKKEYILTHIVTLMNMGEMKCETGDKVTGEKMLREALALTRQYKLPDQEASILINFVYLQRGEHLDSSLSYLNQALALVRSTGNKPSEMTIYKSFCEVYERHKNYQEANKYYKLIYDLNDSLYNLNKAKEIANITSVYDLQQSNTKVKELEILVNSNGIQRNIIIGIAVLLFILIGVLFIFYRKTIHLNHKLEEGQKDLAELNTMKDKLFMVIGHDLRGPVANIPVIIDIIEDEVAIPEEYKDLLISLKDHANITLETLDKLMLLGKSAIKGTIVNPTKFDPKIYITKNTELIAFAAQKKDIEIIDETPANLRVFGDPGHFDFIIRNLLSNAIKFSFIGGKIIVSAKQDNVEGMVHFSVRDFGAGISEAALGNMFKASVKSTYGTANEKGNGIGLILCREFVELDGGKIWVESTEGKGAIFCFSMKIGK